VARKIGEVLREARLQAKLSIRDVERTSGMPAGAISQIETGARVDPGFSSVTRLAKAIGVSLDDLAARVVGSGSKSAEKRGAAIALAEIVKFQSESERAAKRLERAAAALAGPVQKKPRKTR